MATDDEAYENSEQFAKDLFFLFKLRQFVDKTVAEMGTFPSALAASLDPDYSDPNFANVPAAICEEGFLAVKDYLQKLAAHENWEVALLIIPSKASCYAFPSEKEVTPEILDQIKEDHILGEKHTYQSIMTKEVVVIVLETSQRYFWTIASITADHKTETFHHPCMTLKNDDGTVVMTDNIALIADTFMNLIPKKTE